MERTKNFFRLHPTFPLSRNWCLTLSGAGRGRGGDDLRGRGKEKFRKLILVPLFRDFGFPHLRFPLLPYCIPLHRVVICSTTYFHSKNDGKFGAVPIAL